MNGNIRTDLAVECCPEAGNMPDGSRLEVNETDGGFRIERMRIFSRSAAERLGKPCGNYVTFGCGGLNDLGDGELDEFAGLIGAELVKMAQGAAGKAVSGEFSVLIAGLGNSSMTPDAVGPETVSRLTVTRHLAERDPSLFSRIGCCRVSALVPGVLGQTGIETAELVAGVVENVAPDVVIAVDALAARSVERLASTVQLSDTGIRPGSGVGNHRGELSSESLGVPVLALGVPTVVDTATLVFDLLSRAGHGEDADRAARAVGHSGGFFVSPKECDRITRRAAVILSRALDAAFGINLGQDE